MPLSIVDGVLLAVFFFLLYKVYGRLGVSSSGLPLPPGPRRLPLIGSVHHIPLEHQHVAFMNWKETYGVSPSFPIIRFRKHADRVT